MAHRITPGSKADLCARLLEVFDLEAANRFRVGFSRSVYTQTCPDDLEAINRYWRAQMSRVPNGHTSDAYASLSHSPDYNAWLSNFQRYVIPVIKAHGLPILS